MIFSWSWCQYHNIETWSLWKIMKFGYFMPTIFGSRAIKNRGTRASFIRIPWLWYNDLQKSLVTGTAWVNKNCVRPSPSRRCNSSQLGDWTAVECSCIRSDENPGSRDPAMGASFLNTTPHGRHNTLDVYCIIVHCTSSLHYIVICNRYFCRIAIFHKNGRGTRTKNFQKNPDSNIRWNIDFWHTHKISGRLSKNCGLAILFKQPRYRKNANWDNEVLVQFWRLFGPQIHISWPFDFIFTEYVPFMGT